jgi:glycosyltransferase involved in cell wall biosynthesis
MNIIILSPTKQSQGGVERFVYYLREGLEEGAYTATVLGREDLSVFQKHVLKFKKLIGMEQPVLGYFLGNLAKKQGFDVCVTNGMMGWNIKKEKTINVQHGTFARSAIRIDKNKNILKYFIKWYVWGFFEGLAARHASVCVAVSKETKESVEKYYHAKNVQIILNAVDTSLFMPMILPKKNQVIFVGRFEHAKGKEILEGLQKYFLQQGTQLIVAETLSQNELAAAYNESLVFLLPSLHEGCSYALIDAMACGLPFLASSVGLVPELQQQSLFTDCIVIEQTVEAYIAAYENLMNKSEIQKEKMSRQLREYILKNHDIDSFNKKYMKILSTKTTN